MRLTVIRLAVMGLVVSVALEAQVPALLKQACVGCHSSRQGHPARGGLDLSRLPFDLADRAH